MQSHGCIISQKIYYFFRFFSFFLLTYVNVCCIIIHVRTKEKAPAGRQPEPRQAIPNHSKPGRVYKYNASGEKNQIYFLWRLL